MGKKKKTYAAEATPIKAEKKIVAFAEYCIFDDELDKECGPKLELEKKI